MATRIVSSWVATGRRQKADDLLQYPIFACDQAARCIRLTLTGTRDEFFAASLVPIVRRAGRALERAGQHTDETTENPVVRQKANHG